MTIIMAIMLTQAASLFGGADPMEVIKICTVDSDAEGKTPDKVLRSESKARGWSKSEEEMLVKICKSYADGAKQGHAIIKGREKSEPGSSREN